MANTYADYTATSGQTDFAFTFPYLKDTHVIVSIDGTETDINDTGAGSFTIVTSPSTLVRLDSGATAGANVRVKRNSLGKSNTEPALVDYNDGSVLTEKDLDDAYLHNFYLSQEAVEGAAGGMSLDSSNTSWDAQNKKIINVNDPTNTKDAANKTYVDSQINNASLGTTTEAQKWTFTGDNTATEFTFSPAISLGIDTAYEVAIDGVLQEPTTAYTIDADNDKITFTSAPPTSANIVVVNRGYSAPTSANLGTVTSVTAGNGLSGGTITTSGTVSIPTSGGTLNIDSGKVGIGGDADSTNHVKLTGDVLIEETSGTTTALTVKNSDVSGANNAATLALQANYPQIAWKELDGGSNAKSVNLAYTGGVHSLFFYNDDGTLRSTAYSIYPDGNVKLDSLPTSDPSTTGYLWNDGGVVSVSGSSGFSGGGGTVTYLSSPYEILNVADTSSDSNNDTYVTYNIPSSVPTSAGGMILRFQARSHDHDSVGSKVEIFLKTSSYTERRVCYSYSNTNSDDSAADVNTFTVPYSSTIDVKFSGVGEADFAQVYLDGYMTGGSSSSTSSYSSGWVNQSPVDSTSVAANTDLNFTHGLGTKDVVWQIYAADDSSGTNSVAIDIQLDQLSSTSDTWGAAIIDVTNTTCKLSLGSAYIHTAHNTGSGKSWAYVKVVGIG